MRIIIGKVFIIFEHWFMSQAFHSPDHPTLYLVPTPLDFGCESPAIQPLSAFLPAATIEQASRLSHWVCENAKSCRAFLKRVDAVAALAAPLQSLHIQELPRQVHKKGDHTSSPPAKGEAEDWAMTLLKPALSGHHMGLVSEAGLPAVADPGSALVRAAHTRGVRVVPLSGSSSLLLALAASGLNGQNFAFVGYLPQDAAQRHARIAQLHALATRTGQSQLFIETPYRNAALWQALLQALPPQALLLAASGLTLPVCEVRCQRVGQWKKSPWQPESKMPTVFGIGA